MDATAWVAIAGIIGTVAAPMVLEHMRRESARREHLLLQRTDAYADLVRVTARLVDNAKEWALTPAAEIEANSPEDLNRVLARVQVVGSASIYPLVLAFETTTYRFYSQLWTRAIDQSHEDMAAVLEQVMDLPDTATGVEPASEAQGRLDELANNLHEQYTRLVAVIRDEVVT